MYVPARSLSHPNNIVQIPGVVVLALKEFIVLHFRYYLLRNNWNVASNYLFVLFSLPPCLAVSISGTLAFLPLTECDKHSPTSGCCLCGSLCLNIRIPDTCVVHTLGVYNNVTLSKWSSLMILHRITLLPHCHLYPL